MFPLILFLLLPVSDSDETGQLSFAGIPLSQIMESLITDHALPLLFQGKVADIPIDASCQDCDTEQILQTILGDTTAQWERVGEHYLVRFDPPYTGRARGRLVVADTDSSVAGMDIVLIHKEDAETRFTVRTNRNGDFHFGPVPVGQYHLRLQTSEFENQDQGELTVSEYRWTDLHLELDYLSLPTHRMVVTPGRYTLLGEPGTSQYMDRKKLARTPHLGDDVMRALGSLPGANPDGLSARPRPRGALTDEVRITLDGMTLIDPFHARELTGAVSTLDAAMIGELDLISGGYTAELGGAMGGYLQLSSREPLERRTVLGVSFTALRFSHEDVFNDGLGHYMVSARAGHLDAFLGMIALQSEDVSLNDMASPGYHDEFARFRYIFNETHSLSVYSFTSGDVVDYDRVVNDTPGHNQGSYHNVHFWANWQANWRPGFTSDTRFTAAAGESNRSSHQRATGLVVDYEDQRELLDVGFSQDLRWQRGHHLLKFGWQFQRQEAIYDYYHFSSVNFAYFGPMLQSLDYDLDLEGDAFGLYGSWRYALHRNLVVELGARLDDQQWIEKSQSSPRINLAWKATPRGRFNLAWGRFHQARELYQLQLEDGIDTFPQAPLAEHRLMGFSYELSQQGELRVEFFRHHIKDPSPRFENLWSSEFFLPQLSLDRIEIRPESGGAEGFELSARGQRGHIDWLANYAYNKVWDTIDGERRPRRREQRHTVNFNLGYRITPRWNLNLVWHYHTGWHTTSFSLVQTDQGPRVEPGPINGERFPDYNRLDLRLNRDIGPRGFSWYLDVLNATNRQNPRGHSSIFLDGDGILQSQEETGLPFLFTFGVNWRIK